jgi:hypothetical protein
VSSGEHQILDTEARRAAAAESVAAALAENFARATPILSALVASTPAGETLIVATDSRGFPVAQKVARRPGDLPHALVIGRHNRCGLSIANDNRVSLRHLLLTIWPGQGGLLMRGYDLGGRAGVILPDGKRVPGFSAHGHVALCFGRTCLYALPGGPEGVALLEGNATQAFERVTGLTKDGEGGGLAVSAAAEPGVAELGGYRQVDIANQQRRGYLQLRSTKTGHEDDSVRELDVTSEQLQRGLLIGRYSDRCSLAGAGRNLSRVHALVCEEGPNSLLVYDLASTNGVRPGGVREGPSHPVVRITPDRPCMLGHFELGWVPHRRITVH